MSKAVFLNDIEGLSDEFVSEDRASELLDDAKELIQSFEEDISELKEEVEGLTERNNELEELTVFTIDGTPYDNLRGKMIFEKMFENLKYIPIGEVESLVEKHAVL